MRTTLLMHRPPPCHASSYKPRAAPDEQRCLQRLGEHQTPPPEFCIRSEPAQYCQRFFELSPAAVRVENKPFICGRLWRYSIDEYVAACRRVAIQHFIVRAPQNNRGQRRIKGVTVK